jgi:FkbM family methyltransferase
MFSGFPSIFRMPTVKSQSERGPLATDSRPSISRSLKSIAVKYTAILFGFYFRRFPLRPGKRAACAYLVLPYLQWRLPQRHVVIKTTFGSHIKVQMADPTQSLLYFFGVWEPTITKYIQRSLQTGDIFIDIGANIGYDTLLAAKCVGPTGHVYAFEASPRIYSELTDNIERNKHDNITSFNVAVTDRATELPVYLDPVNLVMSTVMDDVAKERNVVLEGTIRGVPLTEILEQHVICGARLIKIDVEGAEWNVIQGIRGIIPLLSQKTEIIVEINLSALLVNDVSAAMLTDIFAAAGYVAFVIENRYDYDFYIDNPESHLRRLDLERDQKGTIDVIFKRL